MSCELAKQLRPVVRFKGHRKDKTQGKQALMAKANQVFQYRYDNATGRSMFSDMRIKERECLRMTHLTQRVDRAQPSQQRSFRQPASNFSSYSGHNASQTLPR